jgi:hypothetical protein
MERGHDNKGSDPKNGCSSPASTRLDKLNELAHVPQTSRFLSLPDIEMFMTPKCVCV